MRKTYMYVYVMAVTEVVYSSLTFKAFQLNCDKASIPANVKKKIEKLVTPISTLQHHEQKKFV